MKRTKVDTNANNFPGCPETYYCEYYFTSGDWWIVGANTEQGYYCPDDPPLAPGNEGDHQCTDTFPENSQVVSYTEGEHYVEYEFKGGQFQLSHANCPVGFHAPADPLEFAKEHGTLRIYPARIKKAGPSETA